jgi:hypothetical protein
LPGFERAGGMFELWRNSKVANMMRKTNIPLIAGQWMLDD